MKTFRLKEGRTLRFPIMGPNGTIGGEIIAVPVGRFRDAKTGEEYTLHVLPTDGTGDEYLGPVGDA